ncbi:uncharacterized protein LOC131942966 [Physella acuta]|uniref:uncharacterized protein LOC131942966 n=1 Tax=Physella acuta TaxID=109671 RepID=UPI0027DBAD3E|nr:uncharacterized protein LOC131942966 [Physella acuta]
MKLKNSQTPASTSPRHERTTTKDERYTDNMRPARAISPAFRSGPRQRRYDPSTDEIIRFVREFQRPDIHGPHGLQRKSVLPAIGGVNSNDMSFDVTGNSSDMSHDMMTSRFLTNPVGLSSTDDEDGGVDHQQCAEGELPSVQRFDNSFTGPKRHEADLAEAVFTNRKSTSADDQTTNLSSRDLPEQTASVAPTPRFNNGTSRGAQLLRPRPLPQLPPIMRGDPPARPAAPSPSLTPPTPRSSYNSDED